MTYLQRHGTRRVPQWVPLIGQVENSAGGFGWSLDVWARFPLPRARLRGRVVLRVGVVAHP